MNFQTPNPIESGFDQTISFVVFRGGMGGNFFKNIFNSLHRKDFDDLVFSTHGNAHYWKYEANNSINCGWAANHNISYSDVDEQLRYWRNAIILEAQSSPEKELHNQFTGSSHNFKNIPLYRKLFKNAKILAIHSYSVRERCIEALNVSMKWMIDGFVQVPDDQHIRAIVTSDVKSEVLISSLKEHVGEPNMHLLDIMLADRKNKNIVDVLCYLRTSDLAMEQYYDLPKTDFDLLLAAPVRDHLCIDDDCVFLTTLDVYHNEINKVIDAIEQVYQSTLSEDQRYFVIRNLRRYRESQPTNLIDDVIGFHKKMKANAILQLQWLVDTYGDKSTIVDY